MSTSSPISNISMDCFMTIFDILTSRLPRYGDTVADRPIVVVRAASQVCRQWRALLISSPWIWGRIVDLHHGFLPPKRQEWMETVVQRAGSSHLWIHGNVLKLDGTVMQHFNTQDFFVRLLDGDLATWERVERLSVTIHGQEIPEIIQRCFLSRAPALRTFEVVLPDMPGDQYLLRDINEPGGASSSIVLVQGQGRTSLFADHAPSLRIIRAPRVIPILHYLHSPWLSHIRKMAVPPCVRMDDIYAILKRTPILECLSLDLQPTLTASWGAAALQPLMPRYKADLRRLTDVRIKTNLLGCTKILEYLSTSRMELAAFRLEICASHPSIHFPSETRQLYKHLPLYISRYFRADDPRSIVPEKVLLVFEQREFLFMDGTGSRDYNPAFVDFLIHTYHNDWEGVEEDSVKNCILDSMVQAAQAKPGDHRTTFGSIKELVLGFPGARPTLHQHLYSVLSVFNFVQTLRTGEHCMDVIWEITSQHLAQGNPHVNASTHVQLVLFPEIRVFHLTSIADGKFTGLRGLLKKRKELGCPMPKLDLRETQPRGPGFRTVKRDFSIFEEVDGLEVVWKRLSDNNSDGSELTKYEVCSYICGSGDPAQLEDLPLYAKRC